MALTFDQRFPFGREARDVVTGFRGVILARCQYATGCDQVLIAPTKTSKDGGYPDTHWFDDARVELVGTKSIALAKRPGADGVRPGRDEPLPPGR